MRPLTALASIAALAACCALPGLAQDPPTPAPDGVPLAFKHKTGDLARYRGNVKMDLAITPEGGGPGGGPLGPIPVSGSTVFAYTEKVTGTREGTGTISMVMESFTSSVEALGQKVVTKFQNGKATVSQNGKPLPTNTPEVRDQIAELKKPTVIRRTPLGRVTAVSGERNAFAGIFGGNTPNILQLAEQALKPGDTWETRQVFRPSLAGSGANRIVIPAIDFTYTHTLRAFETKNGRRTALVDSTGSGATAEGGDNSVNQSVTGATRFDIQRGTVMSSAYNIVLSMRVSPGGAAGGPGALRLDGTVDVTVMEAPAPAKKPAPKKR